MTPAGRLIGLALAVVLVASGCGFQERRAQADFVVDTADRIREAGGMRMIMAQGLVPIELTDTDIQTHPFPIPIAGPLDLNTRRAAPGFSPSGELSEVFGDFELPEIPGAAQGLGTDVPFMIFDGDMLYLRRLGAEEGERSWARLDLGEIDEDEVDDPIIGFNIINPSVWVELVGGALSGSVERMGTEDVGGEELVHYEANFDYEKAFDDLDDDEFQQLTVLFELMGVQKVVVPGELWLDEQGLPRRILYRVEQRFDRTNAFGLLLAFGLSDLGTEQDIQVPGPDDTVEVDGVLQLIAEFGADQIIESFRSQIPVPTPPPDETTS